MRMTAAALASGAMWFLSTGVNHVWPLAWFAPLPLLVVIPDLPARRAAAVAFAASALGGLNLAVAYVRLPVMISGGAVLLLAVQFTAVALAWRWIARPATSSGRPDAVTGRGRHPAVAAVAFAALTVVAEYVVSLLSPHGSFGSLAYSQADLPVVLQLAAVTGLWGITFVVSLVPAALALAWRNRREGQIVLACVMSAVVPVVFVLGFGLARFAASSAARTVSVGLAANDAAVPRFDATSAADALPVIEGYAARSAALADRGAQIVVLPEKFVGVTPEYEDQARALLSGVARDHRVMIVAGLNLVGRTPARNVALVFDSRGRVILEYDKQHLVPGLEAPYRPGPGPGIVPGLHGGVGVAICKDLDFTALGRAYGRAGTSLLLVPAWDFVTDGWLHSRMAIVRGVENGFAVARAASEGRLTVSDARGVIVEERRSDDGPDVLLTATVPVVPGGTLYSRWGDWFAWLAAAFVIACVAARPRFSVQRRIDPSLRVL